MTSGRRGFTLIEVAATLALLSLLVGISIPKYQAIRQKSVGAAVLGGMLAIRTAAFQYNEAAGAWPPSAAAGRVPAGLATYLPGGFTFTGRDATFTWQTTTIVSGGVRRQVGQVQARPTDGLVCPHLGTLLGGTKNQDVTIACTARGGIVALFIDR